MGSALIRWWFCWHVLASVTSTPHRGQKRCLLPRLALQPEHDNLRRLFRCRMVMVP